MATPQVPPRPARLQQATETSTTEANMPAPRVPQRPAGRRKDRSQSPSRYAPSPLNDLPRAPSRKSSASGLYIHARGNRSDSSIDAPARPPSVSLPSIGQEGNEYRDLAMHEEHNALDRTVSGTPVKTSHIDSDLPLHAPRASLSKSSARAQVAAVTRTDSSQGAAAGLPSPVMGNDQAQSLKSKASSTFMRSGSSLSTERPGSASQLDEHGIPHIGRYVPMLPNAGDVQAPSPVSGQGFGGPDGQEGTRKRHHGRKHSGREIFHGPPGSYGLHGHGNHGEDKFEKNWYAKHPEELVKEEQGHYSPALASNRPEWALSSDDLNKIVRDTGKGSGLGKTNAASHDSKLTFQAPLRAFQVCQTSRSATWPPKSTPVVCIVLARLPRRTITGHPLRNPMSSLRCVKRVLRRKALITQSRTSIKELPRSPYMATVEM